MSLPEGEGLQETSPQGELSPERPCSHYSSLVPSQESPLPGWELLHLGFGVGDPGLPAGHCLQGLAGEAQPGSAWPSRATPWAWRMQQGLVCQITALALRDFGGISLLDPFLE